MAGLTSPAGRERSPPVAHVARSRLLPGPVAHASYGEFRHLSLDILGALIHDLASLVRGDGELARQECVLQPGAKRELGPERLERRFGILALCSVNGCPPVRGLTTAVQILEVAPSSGGQQSTRSPQRSI